ncbi:3-hydroxybutyryl-CoA dehydrogenase [candidate division WOR-3 bacterium]|uniref:3-hydroxybutyryl-CoA dehydrogenase n=1 Tax=candidate division WOR-3 bacterium TaxID=2052148 RepID=A0A660SC16_UNCW3|nr:MAG: 3-hydroxybutyryl-CoA dehydrogenase [candidate division WOR-3 bacterium]
MKIGRNLNIVVIGVGKVGTGIVQAFAQSGFAVKGIDNSSQALQLAQQKIDGNLSWLVSKEKISQEEKATILERIQLSSDYDEIRSADVVIESVFEDLNIKKELFGKMDKLVESSDALLLSNTSSLSISEIASATKRPQQVAGMHFFNPVPIMKLVEVVQGIESSRKTVEQVKELAVKMGKVPIVSKDSPGFIVNRMLNALFVEAARIVEEGVGTIEDVDIGAKLGLGHPMGPFELADYLDGIPLLIHICQYMQAELGPRFRVPVWVKNYVRAGRTGRSSGKGFFEYNDSK